MHPSSLNKNSRRALPVLLFLLSAIFLALLLTTIQEGVFFSGDGGFKFLVIRQHTPGSSYTNLHLQSEPWVSGVWNKGYYPLSEPFVYDSGGDKVISFPPFFQQLTRPLYARFGWTGLYIIPMLSLLLLWAWFLWLMQATGKSMRVTVLLYCVLVFCSPLTLYGALFWEHTLSVLLLFAGLVFLLLPRTSLPGAVVLGLLCGLSAWFRPEGLLLAPLLGALVGYDLYKHRSPSGLPFLIALFVALAGFLWFNLAHYHTLLGPHGYQLQNNLPVSRKLAAGFEYMTHMLARLVFSFPVALVLLGFVLYRLYHKKPVSTRTLGLVLISLSFAFVMPFFAPNAGGVQWGPRYLLMLIPVLLVAAAYMDEELKGAMSAKMGWVLVPVLLYSTLVNSYLGYTSLRRENRTRVKPCLEYLRRDTCKNLVVANQYIAQELAALIPGKNIFRLESTQSPDTLQNLLNQSGVKEVLFIDWQGSQRAFCPPAAPDSEGRPRELLIGQYRLTRCRW